MGCVGDAFGRSAAECGESQNKEHTMNKTHRMQKPPIAMAAALAFLAIGSVENAKARPLDTGPAHHRAHHYGYHHGYYGRGWHGGYHPPYWHKYYPRPLSSYYRYQ